MMPRTSDDLPDALGPRIPRPCPAFIWKVTSDTVVRLPPGGVSASCSTGRFGVTTIGAGWPALADVSTRETGSKRATKHVAN